MVQALQRCARLLLRGLEAALIGAATLALAAAGAWLYGERQWEPQAQTTDQDAFRYGTLGLEIMPLKLAAVLGTTFPTRDAEGKEITIDFRTPLHRRELPKWTWAAEYGFIEEKPTEGARCSADALPIGFTVSHLIPGKAATSPAKFVGLSCAACHSGRLRFDTKVGDPVIGAGSGTADVIAFGDAFKQLVSDPRITARRILDAYDDKCRTEKSFWQRYGTDYAEVRQRVQRLDRAAVAAARPGDEDIERPQRREREIEDRDGPGLLCGDSADVAAERSSSRSSPRRCCSAKASFSGSASAPPSCRWRHS